MNLYTTNQTKEKIESIVKQYGLELVDTTVGRNGYPSHTNEMLTCDSFSDLMKAKKALIALNCEVDDYYLEKKAGQHFWNRNNTTFYDSTPLDTLGKGSDVDWILRLDDFTEENLKEEIKSFFFGQDDDSDDEENSEENDFDDEVNELFTEINCSINNETIKAHVFCDMDNTGVDYVVTNDSTGFTYDSRSYCLAIFIDFCSDEEE